MNKCQLVSLLMAGLAVGALPSRGAEPEGWRIEVTPYLWLVGMNGDLTVNGQKIHFDRSTSDVISDSRLAGSALSVVQYDRFLFWGQVDYYDISTSKMDVKDRPQGGRLDTKIVLGEAALGYQIDGWKEGQVFDLLLGVRATHLSHDLEVYGRGSFQNDSNVYDPILVVRPYLPLFPSKIKGLALNPTLAVGGGGDSDFIYELYVQLQYRISERIISRLGYRTVGYQVSGDHNDNELDARMAGLMLGLGVTF